jgi:hypothetical protein
VGEGDGAADGVVGRSVLIETQQDLAVALERLRRRDPGALAAFILSLAEVPGPVVEQVRTFIVGDDVAEAVQSVWERIKGLRVPEEYEHRHARGREMGASLEFIVASIESLVLPVNPRVAFELLVAVFEADGVAMENCGEHDWEVECAYRRAVGVMAAAAHRRRSTGIQVLLSGHDDVDFECGDFRYCVGDAAVAEDISRRYG